MNQRLGYVGDRAIFEALVQTKVTADMMKELLLGKGIIASSREKKEDLASYYSSLPISYKNHKQIEDKMAVRKRREKMSSVELSVEENQTISTSLLRESIEEIKRESEEKGYKITYNEVNENHLITIEKNKIDYGLSDLMQNRLEVSEICLEKSENGYVVRATQLETSSNIRQEIIERIVAKHQEDESTQCEITPFSLSLKEITDSRKRTAFLISLMKDKMNEIGQFKLIDVLQAGVHKCYNETTVDDSDTLATSPEEHASKLKSVVFKGSGIHFSREISELSENGFYYVKAVFILEAKNQDRYEVEVEFKDADNCENFSYLLKSVSFFEQQKDSTEKKYSAKKTPQNNIQNMMFRTIEKAAKAAFEDISRD